MLRVHGEEEAPPTSTRLFFSEWTDISTYLNVATGNAWAGQSNEKPVPFVTRNPTSFTDGNCGLLLEAGSKNRTGDGCEGRALKRKLGEESFEYAGIGTPLRHRESRKPAFHTNTTGCVPIESP